MKSKEFSERLNAAVRRYHNNAITTAELMEELIKIAKSVKEDQQRGETLNLSEPEIAFYDALAENESAVQALGNEKLRLIVTDLVESVRDNASLDWMHRENARAKLRIAIKKILKETRLSARYARQCCAKRDPASGSPGSTLVFIIG